MKEIEEEEGDGMPVYDTSNNPPFDEDKFNTIMKEMNRGREEKKI